MNTLPAILLLSPTATASKTSSVSQCKHCDFACFSPVENPPDDNKLYNLEEILFQLQASLWAGVNALYQDVTFLSSQVIDFIATNMSQSKKIWYFSVSVQFLSIQLHLARTGQLLLLAALVRRQTSWVMSSQYATPASCQLALKPHKLWDS